VCLTFHFPVLEVCTVYQIVGFLYTLYKDFASILQVANVIIQKFKKEDFCHLRCDSLLQPTQIFSRFACPNPKESKCSK